MGQRTAHPSARLLLVRLEVRLAGAADGAEPTVRNLLELCPRGDPAVGIAIVGVVDEPARGADPKLLRLRRSVHRMAGYRPVWCLSKRRAGNGERQELRGKDAGVGEPLLAAKAACGRVRAC